MATAEPSQKPTTRKSTEIWLVGHPIESLKSSQLPTKKDVLALLMNYKERKSLLIKDAIHATAEDVIDVWKAVGVPMRIKKHVVKKVKALFEEWVKLKKNKENKAKRTRTIEEKEQKWMKDLDQLFDIKSANRKEEESKEADVKTTLKRKYKSARHVSEKATVVSSEADMDSDEEEAQLGDDIPGCSSGPPSGRRKPVVDSKLSAFLDIAKVSHRGAALVLTPALQSLGCDPSEYSCSYSTIRRTRLKHRQKMASNLRAEFRPAVPLTIHWDGKILEDITGREKVDRLPILVSGEGVEQLLNVPKLDAGTGIATACAVHETSESWSISNRIKSMCFDTTASNTGLRKGACILLEQKMEKDMLWLACRHHIMEIMLEAVVTSLLPPSTGPEIVLFKRFRSAWTNVDKTDCLTGLRDDLIANELADVAENIIAFAVRQLEEFQPRDDYRELLQLTIIFLGGTIPRGAFSFRTPGGLHRARWMAKAIYSLKIWIFRNQFPLTPEEENAIRNISLFTVNIYIKCWFSATSARMAPNNDLQLLRDLKNYEAHYPQVASVALKKILGHLWYLSEELVALAFFDDNVSLATKKKMVSAIRNTIGDDDPPKRIALDPSQVQSKALEDFVTSNTLRFFQIMDLPHSFLDIDVDNWSTNDDYTSCKRAVVNLRVVNDLAERGVALMEEYNKIIVNDEQQKQFLLQVVKRYRQIYPDRNKDTLIH